MPFCCQSVWVLFLAAIHSWIRMWWLSRNVNKRNGIVCGTVLIVSTCSRVAIDEETRTIRLFVLESINPIRSNEFRLRENLRNVPIAA